VLKGRTGRAGGWPCRVGHCPCAWKPHALACRETSWGNSRPDRRPFVVNRNWPDPGSAALALTPLRFLTGAEALQLGLVLTSAEPRSFKAHLFFWIANLQADSSVAQPQATLAQSAARWPAVSRSMHRCSTRRPRPSADVGHERPKEQSTRLLISRKERPAGANNQLGLDQIASQGNSHEARIQLHTGGSNPVAKSPRKSTAQTLCAHNRWLHRTRRCLSSADADNRLTSVG